ncbi:hypothetical protein PILCRDRAFT_821634 [Piloderma croceum F 1598]|uniref:Uncharacterized protein n=1 Tax=Piloderma croceum (strain F 1598) TaxID=765440 RepID=A0A0C3BV46_PILCF|nr:hypothetical protein PILCRDRAFT_821634 [Piloderma croceum F 1598]
MRCGLSNRIREVNGQVGSRYPDRHPAVITSHLRMLPQVASSFHLPVDRIQDNQQRGYTLAPLI